jgi:methanogenic corrinoid protein MtbC1
VIRWCSYCQRFIGERPPYDDLSVTHGICSSCLGKPDVLTDVSDRIVEVAAFFRDFLRRAVRGSPPEPAEVIDAGRELGIRPVDILLGVAQPTLYKIGDLFAAGRVSPQREHKLSERVEAVIAAFEDASPRSEDAPRVLLGGAPGNKHRIGARIFALTLAEEGIAVDEVDHVGRDAVEEALARRRYDCVGFSVALPGQIRQATERAEAVKRLQPGVLVALGGCVTKDPLANTQVFDLIADPRSSLDTARRLASMIAKTRQLRD